MIKLSVFLYYLNPITMKKLFLFTLVFAYCLLAGSCKDDDSSADPPFTPQNYQFTKAYGVLHPSSSTGQPESLQLILSNTGGHSIKDYTGPGEYLSLYLIVSDMSVSDQQILFPSGTYTLSEDPAKAMTVWKSAASFFTLLDASNYKTSYTLTEGSVSITEKAGRYSVSGRFKGYEAPEFTFEFEGIISSFPPEMTTQMELTDATAEYNNQYADEAKFNYTVTLSNANGQKVNFEITTSRSDYFTHIPDGEYNFTKTPDQAGGLIQSSNSYYTLTRDGIPYPIEAGSIRITSVTNGYSVSGTLSNEQQEEIKFEYSGKLPINRASLSFTDGELFIDGQCNGLTYYDYYLMINPGEFKSAGEKMNLYFTGDIDYFYQYLPVRTGEYTVYTGKLPLSPGQVINDLDLSDTGVIFGDQEGNETLYALTEGSMKVTASEMDAQQNLTLVFNAQFQAQSPTDNEVMEVSVSYTGLLHPQIDGSGYWYGYLAHPYSKLQNDLNMSNFADAIYKDFGTGYFYYEGQPKNAGYVQIWFKTPEAEFEEWYDDSTDPSHYFMTIGLNLSGELPAEGIPTGTYTYDKDWTFAPGTFMPGNKIEGYSNKSYGSTIFNAPYTVDIAFGCGPDDEGGTIKIEKSGEIYQITVDTYDDQGPAARKIHASYTGKIISESEWYANSASLGYRLPQLGSGSPLLKGNTGKTGKKCHSKTE